MKLGLIAAGLLAFPLCAGATTVTPHRADDFINNIGANTHLGYNTGSYYNGIGLVHQAISYLWPSGAIVNLRDALPNSYAPNSTYTALHTGYNVVFDLLSSGGSANPQTLNPSGDMTALASLAAASSGVIGTFEGPNEFNINHYTNSNIQSGSNSFNNPSWGTAANIYYNSLLQSAISAHSSMAGIKFVGTTTADGQSPTQNGNSVLASMGDQSAQVDVSSAHIYFYPNGVQPRPNYVSGYSTANGSTSPGDPTAPAYATETGYNTAYSNPVFSGGGDNATYTKLMMNLLADVASTGFTRAYFYELLNDNPGTPGGTDYEGNFGLFSVSSDATTATPKAAAVAIHNLFNIIWDTGASATSFTPASFNYTLSGMPSNSYSQAFQQSDGDTYLMLWAEPTVWNNSTSSEVATTNSTVTVTVPQVHTTLATYDPSIGTSALATASNASSMTITVSDHPVLMLVSGGVTGLNASVCWIH